MWNRDRRREGRKGGFRLEIESGLIWAALMNGLEVNCKLTKIFLLVFPLCCSNLQFQMLSPYPVKWSHNDRPTERTEKPNTYKSRNGHYQKCDMWSQYLNQWHGSGLTMSWKGNELSPSLDWRTTTVVELKLRPPNIKPLRWPKVTRLKDKVAWVSVIAGLACGAFCLPSYLSKQFVHLERRLFYKDSGLLKRTCLQTLALSLVLLNYCGSNLAQSQAFSCCERPT